MFSLLVVTSTYLVLLATSGSGQAAENTFTHDEKIPYFTDTSLFCDHPGLNVSKHADDVQALTWVFPKGENVDSQSDVDSSKYILSSPNSSVTVVGDIANLDNYNLTVLEVNDDEFGYYFCVVEYKASTARRASVIRWGLNVNGADFSELLDTYKKNAIIGGIAAAVMLVLVGGSCLFWHYRNTRGGDEEEDSAEDDLKKDGIEITPLGNRGVVSSKAAEQGHVYTNSSFNAEADTTEIDLHDSNNKEDNMVRVQL